MLLLTETRIVSSRNGEPDRANKFLVTTEHFSPRRRLYEQTFEDWFSQLFEM